MKKAHNAYPTELVDILRRLTADTVVGRFDRLDDPTACELASAFVDFVSGVAISRSEFDPTSMYTATRVIRLALDRNLIQPEA